MVDRVQEYYSRPATKFFSFIRLPPELLQLIFIHLRRQPFPDRTFDWLHVFHVCRQWRLAALCFPPFWKNVDGFMVPQLRDLFLENVKLAPLSISSVELHHDRIPGIEPMLRGHLSHTADLHIHLSHVKSPQLEEWIHMFFEPRSAPLLRQLEVDIYPRGSHPYFITVPDVITNLSSLSLTDVRLRFSNNRIQPNINQFTFESFWENREPTVLKTQTTLTTLQLMPNLTVLKISDSSFEPHTSIHTSVSLPLLQRLSFAGAPIGFLFLSDCLIIPPKTKVELRLNVDSASDGAVGSLFSNLQERLRSQYGQQLQPSRYKVLYRNHVWGRGPYPLEEFFQIIHIPEPSMACSAFKPIDLCLRQRRFGDETRQMLPNIVAVTEGIKSAVEQLEVISNAVFNMQTASTVLNDHVHTLLAWTGLRVLTLQDIQCAQRLIPWLLRQEGKAS